MPTITGSLRRLVLTPSLAEVSFAKRGFPIAEAAPGRALEAIPQAVVCGFEWGIDARDQWEVERRLALVDPEQRGFAYEGATMAFTVLDAMGPRRGHRTRDLLRGPGRPHIFLAYIGIGFAMARLPRVLWRKVLPDLTGSPYHPTMSWLAVDGLGFDRAYFHTRRWVDAQEEPAPYPWLGRPDYFPRAFDQGVGRALWFVHGGAADAVAGAVGRFTERRRADLWSGAGLAAAFAGGAGPDGYAALRVHAGEHAAALAQGAVFAAKARCHAGFVPDHTREALRAIAGLTVEAAERLADDSAVEPDAPNAPGEPAYERWRANVREGLPTR
ncbi:DUF1702 family protein [Actinomadura opuntiae]|uniref:DUF1702 family protein n=1 Tax=Actinomadura sp. OS1-43 TaxID=604315 RepID=UPI00255AF739|nr:DUF1702 family protein [Actinomadura sp. OS1-43]MDL4820299.1 DUF1702 family protein [Actinomadura sp. OS1-43]